MGDIVNTIQSALTKVLLFIDAIIYSLINWVYKIILALCDVNILGENFEIEALVNRVYIIIGVVVLFLVAYSLLKNMVNPDEALKGKKSPATVIKDIIISIALIALIPTIFQFAFNFQSAILSQNTIGNIILGTGTGNINSENLIETGGIEISSGVLEAFLHENYTSDKCTYNNDNSTYDCSDLTIDTTNYGEVTYSEFWANMKNEGSLFKIEDLSDSIAEGDVTYYYIISTIAGVFVLLVFISYCFDISLRVIKLAVYELIAPLPILARLMPNEQGSKTFSNWIKACISTYVEVFIRLGILYFAVLMVKIVIQNFPTLISPLFQGTAGFTVALFAQMFIIVGIILFVKQAPSIIKEITGLDGGKFNVLKSAKQGLATIGGLAVGKSPAAAFRAWEETGKDGNLRSIGNQLKRRALREQAKDRQKEAGLNPVDRFFANRSIAVRQAIGYPTMQESLDDNFKKHKKMDGKEINVVNDSGIDILNKDGKTTYLNKGANKDLTEEVVNELNEIKAYNNQKKSEIAETVRIFNDVHDTNKVMADFKKEMEEIAKSEMMKGKFHLVNSIKDANGHRQKLVLSYSSVDANGNTITNSFGTSGATQKEYEAWLEANRERMNADDYAKLSKELKDSINKNSVEEFVDFNGEFKGAFNDDIQVTKKKMVQHYTLNGGMKKVERNSNGELEVKEADLKVYDKDGNVVKDLKSEMQSYINNELDITFDFVNSFKDVTKAIRDDTALKINELKTEQGIIDARNSAIDRLFAQEKEQIEMEKESKKYKATVANEEARKLNNQSK